MGEKNMRNNFKKFAALALVLVMLVSTFVPAFAATTCPGANATHTASNCEYTIVGSKDATCTEAGFETGRCSTCNTQFTVSAAPATGHTWAEAEGDCTTGVTKTCANCGLVEVVTTADGHVWTPWTLNTDACEIGAQAQRACTACQLKQSKVMTEKHNWELVEYTVPVKCVSAGEASYKCTTKDCTATKTEKVLYATSADATGDSMHASWQYIGYNYSFEGLDADGEAKTYHVNVKQTADIILKSGVVITKEYFNAQLDKFVAPGTGVCLTGAVEPKFCLDCGTWAMDGIPGIPANAFGLNSGHWGAKHSFGTTSTDNPKVDSIVKGVLNPDLLPKSGATYHAAVAPTCTTAGTVEYWECAYGCGTYLYNATSYVKDPEAADGTATVAVKKTTADAYVVTQKLSDLAIAPQHWNYYTVAQAATCTASGQTAHYCILCGDANIKTYTVTAPTGHTYYCDLSVEKQAELMQQAINASALANLVTITPAEGETQTQANQRAVKKFLDDIEAAIERDEKDPSCLVAGSTTYGCLVCAEATGVKVVEGAPATGHIENPIPGTGSVAPSCVSNGVYVYWCAYDCGATLRSETIDPLGHVMTAPVVVTAATCQAEGKLIYTCARPGCIYAAKDSVTTDEAAKYVEIVAGTFVHVDLSENFVTIPKAHVWAVRAGSANGTAGAAIVPTCADVDVADRIYDRVCTVEGCGVIELGVVYDAVAHEYDDFDDAKTAGKVTTGVIGTCETQGIYYIGCKNCGGAPVKYVDPDTGNGHNNLVLFEGKAATCGNEYGKAWTEASVCLECYHVEVIKYLYNNHVDVEETKATGSAVLYGFNDILMNKEGIDLWLYNAVERKLTKQYTSVASVPSNEYEMIVALKRGAKVVDGKVVNAEDIVPQVQIAENVVWTFYVPGDCTTQGYFGGQLCTLCNNAGVVDGVSRFNPMSGGNNGQICGDAVCTTPSHTTESKHVRTLVYTETAKCDQYGYKRYACKFCDDSIQLAYVEPAHTFTETEDDTSVMPNCELDGYHTLTCVDCGLTESYVDEAWGHQNQLGLEIVDSCIDRTGDRYCIFCATIIAKNHRFGEWTEADGVKTRECADCAYVETEPVETEPVETEPAETEPAVTEPAETEPAVTEPAETEPAVEEKGCGSSIAAIAVALVATLGTCVVFAGKKRD